MKIKNIMMAAAAIFTLGFVASCDTDYDPTYLGSVKVSSSYVSLEAAGSSTTIQVSSSSDWYFELSKSDSAWLTVTPAAGSGNQEVTFTAIAATSTNSTTVLLHCGSDVQRINVLQQCEKVETPLSTCAAVNSGTDGVIYRIKGTVTNISSTVYGNMNIEDETGTVYIYGTLDAAGATKNFSSLGIEVGDIVTVEGPKSTYGSTIELVDVTVINIEKSLIKCDSLTVNGVVANSLPSDGGEIVAHITTKGSGLYVEVPEAVQSWVSIKALQGNNVVFAVAANTAGPREATLTFTTTDGTKVYSSQATFSQEGLAGTAEVPFSVSEAIAYLTNLKGTSASDVYVKGKVSKIASAFSANYGNGTFWISEDGVYNEDVTKDFEAYRVLWFDNQKWAEGNKQVAVGDEVILCGKITYYADKTLCETSGNAAWVYSVNGVKSDVNGLGNLEAPFTAKGAIEAAKAGASDSVYVTGIVSKIVSAFGTKYGNGSFWISEDGNFNNDKSLDFEVYQSYWLNNQKWTETDYQLAVGDSVMVRGLLTVYQGTCEMSGKKSYIYSYTSAAQK